MRKQIEPEPDYLRKLGYEPQDISLPTLVKLMLGLFAFVAFSSVVAFVLYLVFVGHDSRAAEAGLPAGPAVHRLAPEPRLQANPVEDIAKFRVAEDRVLNGYAWKDRAKGTVQVPIDEAVRLEAQRLVVTPGGK